jgi:hypothetical protein
MSQRTPKDVRTDTGYTQLPRFRAKDTFSSALLGIASLAINLSPSTGPGDSCGRREVVID